MDYVLTTLMKSVALMAYYPMMLSILLYAILQHSDKQFTTTIITPRAYTFHFSYSSSMISTGKENS